MRLPTAGGVLGVGTVVVIAPSLSVNGPRGRTNRRRCYQRSSSPDALASAELAPSPGEHRSRREGCRASQGRFPPPLWIRCYAVGRYGGHRSSWRLAPPTAFARSRVRAFRVPGSGFRVPGSGFRVGFGMPGRVTLRACVRPPAANARTRERERLNALTFGLASLGFVSLGLP